ncbi:MAG: hypothetical protein GYB31_17105 [Bacteroidetes bacterium]|nr:hypothetical protein [Bacteroidota bacterium]
MKFYDLDKALKTPDRVQSLILHQRGYSRIPDVIATFPRLRELALSSNRIETIPAFLSRLENLEILDLSGNLIELKDSDLPLPESLLQLKLANNKIKCLSVVLPNSLEKLDLSGNPLSKSDPLEHLPRKLRHLRLAACGLEKIPDSIYALSRLESLDLSENEIRFTPVKGEMWKSLISLDLRKNKLTHCRLPLPPAAPLAKLKLNHNKLQQYPKGLEKATQLQTLELTDNRLKTFRLDIRFAVLRNIDLSRNKLESLVLPWSLCPMLRQLNVSNNKLESLPDFFWENLPLQRLDLSKNKLQSLSGKSGSVTDLRQLNLDSNKLEKLNLETGLEKLEQLSLRRNKLPGIPGFIWGLDRLKKISGLKGSSRLMRFLLCCRSEEIPIKLRPVLFAYYQGAPNLPVIRPDLMHAGLTLPLPALHKSLWNAWEEKHPLRALKKGDTLKILGPINIRRKSIENAGLNITDDPAKADFLVPASGRDWPSSTSVKSPASVRVFIRESGKKALEGHPGLEALLESKQPANVQMALSVIGRRQLPARLLSLCFINWVEQKDPALRKKLERLLWKQLPARILEQPDDTETLRQLCREGLLDESLHF